MSSSVLAENLLLLSEAERQRTESLQPGRSFYPDLEKIWVLLNLEGRVINFKKWGLPVRNIFIPTIKPIYHCAGKKPTWIISVL
jgi:hypothetical protein